MCRGRFQSLGAEQLKAQAPMVLMRHVGIVSEGGNVFVKEVKKVSGGWIVESR